MQKLKDVILFSIIISGFVIFKAVKGVKTWMKPKVYTCSNCHEPIIRGSGVRIGKDTICLNCFNKINQPYVPVFLRKQAE